MSTPQPSSIFETAAEVGSAVSAIPRGETEPGWIVEHSLTILRYALAGRGPFVRLGLSETCKAWQ
jgi:hypothetical protein